MLACLRSSSLTSFWLNPFCGWVHPVPRLQITRCTLMTLELIPLSMTSTNTKLNSWFCPSLLPCISLTFITIFEVPFTFLLSLRAPEASSYIHIPRVLCFCLQLLLLVPRTCQLPGCFPKPLGSGMVFLYPELCNPSAKMLTTDVSFKNLDYSCPICLPSPQPKFPSVQTVVFSLLS